MTKPITHPTESSLRVGWIIECDGKHAAASIEKKYMDRPDLLALLIKRLIQEMQIRGGIPADKPFKVYVDDQFGK